MNRIFLHNYNFLKKNENMKTDFGAKLLNN